MRQLENGKTVMAREEQWNASGDASTWRRLTDDPATGGTIEEAERRGVVSSYDATRSLIYDRTTPSNWKDADHSTAEYDMNAIRIALAYSDAKDVGPATVDGRAVERFDFGSRETNGQTCSYYATRDDLRPVAVDSTNLIGHPWLTEHKTFEWLDRSQANDALLSLSAQHPDARIDRAPLITCDAETAYFGPNNPRNAPCVVNAPGG